MGALIDDDVLSAFAIVAEPDQVARAIRERFEGIVQRISVYEPRADDRRVIASILEEFAGDSAAGGSTDA
jgi:hypothetical protein